MTPPNPVGPLSSLRERPDRELVSASQQGNAEAFNELVRRHQDRLYTAITRFCGNAEDAADIVQRAFVNAWRKIADFQNDSAFFTWLYRIGFNQAISFKREGRRPMASLDASGGDGPLHTPAAEDAEPGGALESDEVRRKVQQALDLLSEDDRQIILLKDLQDHSYDEIAAVLGIPKGTVRSRLHRARLELREKLKSFMGTLQ
jgi:RNA polymerase sigma-70 factor (ECF subfamily)